MKSRLTEQSFVHSEEDIKKWAEEDTRIISFDDKMGDVPILIIGRKTVRGVIDICNSFQGEAAVELWNALNSRSPEKKTYMEHNVKKGNTDG